MMSTLKIKEYIHKNLALSTITLILISFLFVTKPLWDLGWQIGTILSFSPQQLIVMLSLCISILYITISISLKSRLFVGYKGFISSILIVSTISFMIQPSISGLEILSRQLSAFLMLLIFVDIFCRYPQSFEKISRLYLIVLIVPALICYLQFLGIVPYTYFDSLIGVGKVPRASGGYFQPTGYTSYFIISYLILNYLFMAKKIEGIKYLLYIAFTFPALLLTLHRTSLVIVILIMSPLIFKYKNKFNQILVLIIFTVILVVGFQKLSFLLTSGGYKTIEGILHGRPSIWLSYLEYFYSLPIIQQLFGLSSLDGIPVKYLNNFILNEAHSEYIRILICYGYVGFCAVFGFVVALAVLGIKSLKRYTKVDKEKKDIAIMLITSTMVVFLYSFTLETFRYSNLSWGLSFIWAYCIVRLSKAKYLKVFF